MEISRRNFLKTASIGAGLMVASGWSPFSYAANSQVRVGAIGTGGQGSFHLREGIARSASEGLYLTSVCDVYTPHLEGGWREAGGPARESLEPDKRLRKYMDYREMLAKEQLDGVVITTPLNTHYQMVMDSLDSGRHVFVEKCMCYTMEQCREVVIKSHETGKLIQVGHQRRYNPRYNHAVAMARGDYSDPDPAKHKPGVLGRINHIDAQWHRNNDWRRAVPNRELTPEEKQFIKTDLEHHINWRLYWETSDGLMTELGAHQIDVAAWFLNAWPTKVSGYGGIDYWRDGRECPDNVNCILEFEMTPGKAGFKEINPAKTKFQAEYLGPDGKPACNQPYKVVMCYSSITGNANKGAAEFIQGDEGTFELTEADCKFYREANSNVKWFDGARKDAADANAVLITSGSSLLLSNKANKTAEHIIVNMDKTPDQIQFEGFTTDILNNTVPKANAMVGLRSAICALAATRAIKEGTEVVIPPEWYTFDFPTDHMNPDMVSEYGPAESKPATTES